jgi:hypothetical protein
VPLPIVASGSAASDPTAVARLASVALVPRDVAPAARPFAVPEASDFNAILRALYAECDYYTPVGQRRTAHLLTALQVGQVSVYDDLAAYTGDGAAEVVRGVATSLQRCPQITVRSGEVVGRFAVRRIAVPRGVSPAAVALSYVRTDASGAVVLGVFESRGTTLRAVLAAGPDVASCRPAWVRAAAAGWTRLARSA